ncbi:DUF1223 domain-containing protein [Marinomonas sp. 2405UD66-6]|uniref:DUF1223 domain-containing protein n=1 Tax=Marinomonas sp. 2405UD66-6 TaxID=3391834 RepID=UPI0039C95FBF
MKALLRASLALMPLLIFQVHTIQAQEWHSGTKQAQLVELYTSEGCSSCPPADKWLSTLKDHPALFDGLVPVAFHVDYWNYIGWEDPFASPVHTQRQQTYARVGHISQMYTPGFVIDNKEWRAWFRGQKALPASNKTSGELSVVLNDNNILDVNYSQNQDMELHVTYLGMGLSTNVKAGENRNRQLHHDFVALNYLTLPGTQSWKLLLPSIPEKGQERTALAVWVSDRNTKEVLQAVGGYLN